MSVTNEPSSIYKIKDINSRLKDSLLYLLQEDKEVKEAIASQVAKVLKE
ncbi:hypothetical protein [Tenacibaculum mesophilum]|nr:hypothetical protein [Tenacibaculum mesophilum]